MRVVILTLLALAGTQGALHSQKFTKLDGTDNFKAFSDVLANLSGFYYHLRFIQDFEQYEYFCPNLIQELDRFQSVSQLYFALKVVKELRCKLHPQTLTAHMDRVKDSEASVSDASHIFRMLIMVQSPIETILEEGCKRFTKYVFNDSSRVRRTESDRHPSFDYTAMMIRDFWECGMVATEFKSFGLRMAEQAIAESVEVTKEQSAWPSDDTLYDTMDILVAVLRVDPKLVPRNKMERLLKFISSNLSNDMSYREKNKWNQLVSELEKEHIQIIQPPTDFDWNHCGDSCYLTVVGLPPDSKVTASWNGKDRVLRYQKSSVMMEPNEDFKQAKELNFKITNENFHVIPSTFTVKVRRENQVMLVRMAANAQAQPNDLIDSDENECSSIGLTGNEGSFLHVGFRLRTEELFSFVHLEPHNLDFENSAMVHAEYRPEEKLYVASLDFSDYETIRPNSGTYNIWLTVGSLKKQCGQITLTFTNLEKSHKDSLTKAAPVVLTNIPTFKMEDERHYFAGLWFTIGALALVPAYFLIYPRLKAEVPQASLNPGWELVFYGGLAAHVALQFLLLLQYQLIERAYLPVLSLGVLSYLFSKAFIKRHNSA